MRASRATKRLRRGTHLPLFLAEMICYEAIYRQVYRRLGAHFGVLSVDVDRLAWTKACDRPATSYPWQDWNEIKEMLARSEIGWLEVAIAPEKV